MSLFPFDYRRFQLGRLDRSVRNDYQTLDEMRRERQLIAELLAEQVGELPTDAATADESVRFRLVQLEDLGAAITRRERVISRPPESDRHYDQLLNFARDLKALWPVERFCREMLLVELRQVGKELVGRCPFPDHQDSTPSFKVNSEKDCFKCWGCGRGGDVFQLAGWLRGEERFARQVDLLAEVAGITQDAA